MPLHRHQCGDADKFKYKSFDPAKGCGHVFEHDDSFFGKDEEHMCPECGRGPWVIKYPEEMKP